MDGKVPAFSSMDTDDLLVLKQQMSNRTSSDYRLALEAEIHNREIFVDRLIDEFRTTPLKS